MRTISKKRFTLDRRASAAPWQNSAKEYRRGTIRLLEFQNEHLTYVEAEQERANRIIEGLRELKYPGVEMNLQAERRDAAALLSWFILGRY